MRHSQNPNKILSWIFSFGCKGSIDIFINLFHSQCGLIVRFLFGSFDTCDVLEETSSKKSDTRRRMALLTFVMDRSPFPAASESTSTFFLSSALNVDPRKVT